MKSTLLFFIVFIFIIGLCLTACDQKVDLYFYPDEAWEVKSSLTFSPLEKQTIQLADDEFVEFISNLIGLEFSPSISISGDVFASLLDLLSSHYNNLGIDFQWAGRGDNYTFTVNGQTLDQFEQLIPDAISIDKVDETQYHLNINLTEVNSYAALVYHQDVMLYSNNITNHNAPRVKNGSISWQNPNEIDATFEPISQTHTGGLGIVFLLMVVLMMVVLVILVIKKRISQRVDSDYAYSD